MFIRNAQYFDMPGTATLKRYYMNFIRQKFLRVSNTKLRNNQEDILDIIVNQMERQSNAIYQEILLILLDVPENSQELLGNTINTLISKPNDSQFWGILFNRYQVLKSSALVQNLVQTINSFAAQIMARSVPIRLLQQISE